MDRLKILYDEIESRCAATLETRPDWPCGKGCSACCRALASPLRLVWAEWQRLFEALDDLPQALRESTERRLDALAEQDIRPYTCAFLDLDSGACRVYGARPAACRAYGFYVDRTGGRYCGQIESLLEQDGDEGVIWGNHERLDSRLRSGWGEPLGLQEALARRRGDADRSQEDAAGSSSPDI